MREGRVGDDGFVTLDNRRPGTYQGRVLFQNPAHGQVVSMQRARLASATLFSADLAHLGTDELKGLGHAMDGAEGFGAEPSTNSAPRIGSHSEPPDNREVGSSNLPRPTDERAEPSWTAAPVLIRHYVVGYCSAMRKISVRSSVDSQPSSASESMSSPLIRSIIATSRRCRSDSEAR